MCGQGNIRKALLAGLCRGRFRSLNTRQQLLDWQHEEEIDHKGDDQKVDACGQEGAVLDRRRTDGEDEGGKIRLASNSTNQRTDDIIDQRFGDSRECGTDNDGDGQVDDIAAQDEIAKALDRKSVV